MDVTFNNVLEGTRQYFMGLPTGSSTQASVGPGSTTTSDSMLASTSNCNDSSGVSAPSPRPSSTAALASSSTNISAPALPTTLSPPRPPSEPLEPEPHIIHKATVMREALEKRRECLEPEDEDDAIATLSPPSHIIRKPPHALPSTSTMPTAPSPLPGRPPSTANASVTATNLGFSPAPTPPHVRTPTPRRMRSPDTHSEPSHLSLPPSRASSSPYQHQYHTPVAATAVSPARDAYPAARPLDHYTGGRPPDPYSISRPPEMVYPRYHYDTNSADSRNILSNSSPQPSAPMSRQSPQQSYSRLSNAAPQHGNAVRLREPAVPSSPTQRYSVHASQFAATSTQPLNDRVPPIHHPSSPMTSAAPRVPQPDSRSTVGHTYIDHRVTSQRASQERSSFSRLNVHHERHSPGTHRKYDAQQTYPGYRPSVPTSSQSVNNLRIETQHQLPLQYKHVGDTTGAYYPSKFPERSRQSDLVRPHDTGPLPPPHSEYPHMARSSEDFSPRGIHRNTYSSYVTTSTPGSRFMHSTAVVAGHNPSLHQRNLYRSESAVKSNQEYVPSNQVVQSSPTRSSTKSGYPAQQSRLTVSVTSLVNQMNQTKQKSESPLDLSVKTVKNSADSSTTQEDIELTSVENKNMPLPSPSSSSSRHVSSIATGHVSSHKVDFAPDFHSQYRDRINHAQNSCISAPPVPRYNGAHNNTHDSYKSETRQLYSERNKYSSSVRHKYPVSRIDLTRPVIDERHSESMLKDDRNIVIEDNRKRLGGPVVSNIPEKIVRYETWSANSRIDRMNWSAREQQELMSRPVYSYSSHKKRLEAYHSEQKRPVQIFPCKDVSAHSNTHSHYKYTYPTIESSSRDGNNYHSQCLDKNQQNNVRQVIQKIPNHKDISSQQYDHRSGIPADKKVLSILRNSLETKHTGFVEPARPTQKTPDLIVIDDVDDSVIEITDLTKDNDSDIVGKSTSTLAQKHLPLMIHKIHVPRAIDSISNDMDYQRTENSSDAKSKTPENDVASRIRTKAELKVLPPSQDNANRIDVKREVSPEKIHLSERVKILPKSQKQHLFNQIREDNLRLESVIKSDKLNTTVTEIKSEPMNIEEIEKDAAIVIKTEKCIESTSIQGDRDLQEDMDWANTCDMFMEQLKTGCAKKRNRKKHADADECKIEENRTSVCQESLEKNVTSTSVTDKTPIIETVSSSESVTVIKEEPIEAEFEELMEGKENEVCTPNDPKKINTTLTETKSTIEENKTVMAEISCNKNEDDSSAFVVKQEAPDEYQTAKVFTCVKEECESTDDDEPLIKSKLLKEKEKHEQRLKYQLLKDLSEKSAYVKLECCDADLNKSIKLDQPSKEQEGNNKSKEGKQTSRQKSKSIEKKTGKLENATSDSDDDVSVACRLRTRKSVKNEDDKNVANQKMSSKGSPSKKQDSLSNSTPIRKPGILEGSNFYPGWEEELYRYKRSLRMPTRLIAIPRGRSGGPFAHNSVDAITRGSTSLPDLDPAPLSPAPSSAPSAATDDIFARRQDKLNLDSDLESNSSCSAPNRLHYDSEASTSTVFSTQPKKKGESILDVLIQKYGKKDETKKKSKEDTKLKSISKSSTPTIERTLAPSNSNRPKNDVNETTTQKKEKQKNIAAVDSYDNKPDNSKAKSKIDNRIMKQRVLVKELFGDERPASAPPASGGDDKVKKTVKSKNESLQPKKKFKKNIKDEVKKKVSTIRDGLRSTKSLKRNDAKGRLLRLKKRNHIMRSFVNKKMKDANRQRKDQKSGNTDSKQEGASKENGDSSGSPEVIKKRYRRLFGRRKFSSGFDYIRKKKKTIVRDECVRKVRKNNTKPSPESINDIHKEIKTWFINKSVGETSLHRATRLGYLDCVAYCLEKLGSEPSASDNAGYTPLHVAAAQGYVRIARLLLQYGANVSAAASGGIRPLHEACVNSHIEMIRLLLAYGADPVLGTYTGQMPVELGDAATTRWLRLHIADVQGQAVEPWKFHSPAHIIDPDEVGCDPLMSPPPASPPPTESVMEFQCTDAPLPPFYSLHTPTGQPIEGLWCLLQDLISLLQIKSKESLLKQIHCGSGSPRELLRELRTQDFLEHAQCHQLLGTGEKVNVRASKVSLIRVTDKLRQLLNIETVLVS